MATQKPAMGAPERRAILLIAAVIATVIAIMAVANNGKRNAEFGRHCLEDLHGTVYAVSGGAECRAADGRVLERSP